MLYANVYALSGLLSHFLQENPAMESHLCGPEERCRETVDEVTETALSQRLEAWLERETMITDPAHRATLLQLAASYAASATPHDTWTSSWRGSSRALWSRRDKRLVVAA
jgi:hypothetical protein